MAFYDEEEDDDQLDPNAQTGVQTSSESGVISGQGDASQGAQSQSASQPTSAPAPDKSGSFVGIKQYLDANRPQAAKLGDQTAGVVSSSANQARQGVDELRSAADSAIKPTASLGADVYGRLNSGAESLSGDERNALKTTAAAKYTGPRAESDLGDAYTNARKAHQSAVNNLDMSQTEQGRMGLISKINEKPRTQGMNLFDNALLSAGGGRDKVSAAATAGQDVRGSFDAASNDIRNKIGRADDPSTPDVDESAGAIGQTNKAQTEAYSQIQNALNSWKSGFNPRVQKSRDDLVAMNNRISGDLANNPYEMDSETLGLYGLGAGTNVYDLNLSSYLNQGSPGDVTNANAASAEDYARYAALADIAGEQDLLLRPEDAAKAGTLPKTSVDIGRLQSDLGNKRTLDAALGQQDAAVSQAQQALQAFYQSIPGYDDADRELFNFNLNNLPHNAHQNAVLNAQIQAAAAAREQWKRDNGFDRVSNIITGTGR